MSKRPKNHKNIIVGDDEFLTIIVNAAGTTEFPGRYVIY